MITDYTENFKNTIKGEAKIDIFMHFNFNYMFSSVHLCNDINSFHTFLFLLYSFSSKKGKYDGKRNSKLDKSINGGATIKKYFTDLYAEFSEPSFKVTKEYSDKDIDKAIKYHQGDTIPGFPSFDAFLYLIQPQLEKLKEPAVNCLQDTFNYLELLSNRLIEKIFCRFY